jgi:hypothetical protein
MSITQIQKSRPILIGGYALKKTGVARFDRRDPYSCAVLRLAGHASCYR